MGIGLFRSYCLDVSHSSNYSGRDEAAQRPNVMTGGNPNPRNFQIIRTESVGRFTIVEVNYPDCRNYEGNKILVYENVSPEDLRKETSLDPHFCDSKSHPTPIARFVPTARGWSHAVRFCRSD